MLFSSLPPEILAAFAGVFGLVVGSFLNVVIYRLPKMMERGWKEEALAFLRATEPSSLKEATEENAPENAVFNLAYPPSRCGHCGHAIRWYENIPLLSWCIQKAKCSACSGAIAMRYPLVEALTGLSSAWIAYRYGWSIQTLACLAFNAVLMCAFWIDWDTQLLPDDLTLPLIWGGLILAQLGYGLVPFSEAFWGAVSGYGLLWTVYWVFYLLFKKEGMGFGDFKLLSALGAWLGWQALPTILLVASLSGLAYGVFRALTGLRSPSEAQAVEHSEYVSGEEGHRWSKPLPFGPFLIAAGWLTWMVLPPTLFLTMV